MTVWRLCLEPGHGEHSEVASYIVSIYFSPWFVSIFYISGIVWSSFIIYSWSYSCWHVGKLMVECLFFCSCWLSIEGYFIWAFVGPVLFVCLVSLPLFPRLAHKLLELCAIKLWCFPLLPTGLTGLSVDPIS